MSLTKMCDIVLFDSYWRDDVLMKASVSQSVDLGFTSPSRVIPKKVFKMAFTAFLVGAQHKRDGEEKTPASLLAASLGKALNEMPPSLCCRQMVGPSSLPVVVAQSDERHANKA